MKLSLHYRLGMYVLGLLMLVVFSGMAQAHSAPREQVGFASFYASQGITASGTRLHAGSMTAAHRTLPFGTVVRVTNHMNDKSVLVTINDRGPYIRGRVVDLAKKPAQIIGLPQWGVAKVTIQVVFEPPKVGFRRS